MKHEHQTEESLYAWLDNELGSRESEYLDEHLQSCESCAAVLAECRETRATVSYLLQSYDHTLESAPSVPRATRAKLSFSARVPSAPIINHIVANSRNVGFWQGARTLVPVAAAAALLVGSTVTLMMHGYHTVAGSVTSFANVAYKPFVAIHGRVLTQSGEPVRGISVYVNGTRAETVTDASGYFRLPQVPREANQIFTGNIPGYDRDLRRFSAGSGDEVEVKLRLKQNLRTLDPVRVQADSR